MFKLAYYIIDNITSILVALLIIFGYWLYKNFYLPARHFRENGIPYIKPWTEFYNGISGSLLKDKLYSDIIKAYYNSYPNARYVGIFQNGSPGLIIRDISLIKTLAVADFDYFTDHPHINGDEIFPKSLFFMRGKAWRDMRTTINPLFNSIKSKSNIDFMDKCAQQAVSHLENANCEICEIELWDFASKFSNDVVTYACFSLELNSLEDPKNDIYNLGKRMCEAAYLLKKKIIIMGLFPFIMKLVNIPLLPEDITNYFLRLVQQTIQDREANNIIKPDMLQLLIEAQKRHLNEKDFEKNNKPKLTDGDITAQILLNFVGGFDSVATAVSFMALELASNTDIQSRLQKEIDDNTNDELKYEDILKMKFMDQVLSETLRKWASGIQSNRVCNKDYLIEPIRSNEAPYLIKKGEVISIPIAAIHYDPKYFPNPEKFDPDRFNDENRRFIVPGTYNPFGIGPRNCIAYRFAPLEIKIFFIRVLSKFDILLTGKTSLTTKLEKDCFGEKPKGGVYLGFKKRIR